MKFIIFWRLKTPGWDWSITKLITSEFFYKMDPVFFIKSTKIGSFFYKYGYTDITTFRDPCVKYKKKKFMYSCKKSIKRSSCIHVKQDLEPSEQVWQCENPCHRCHQRSQDLPYSTFQRRNIDIGKITKCLWWKI